MFEKSISFFQPEVGPEADRRHENDGIATNFLNAVVANVDRAVIEEGLAEGDIYAQAVAPVYNIYPPHEAEPAATAAYDQRQAHAADVLTQSGVETTAFSPTSPAGPTFDQPVMQELTADQPTDAPESPEVAAYRQKVLSIHDEVANAATGQPNMPTNAAWTSVAPAQNGELTNA